MSDSATVRFGDKLVQVHKELRAWIQALREEVGEFLDEQEHLSAGRTEAPTLAYQLRKNCLEFCHQLHGHHTTEDERFFPALEREFPQLAPHLKKMREEHMVVSDLITRIQDIVSEVGSGEAGRIKAELDTLATHLEEHLDYEEEYIITAMNNLPSTV